MTKTIVEEFETLRSTGRRYAIIAQFTETQDDDPGTQAFFSRYHQAVDLLRSAWGEPVYEGIGPRAGYQGSGPGAIRCMTYSHALRFAWWQTESSAAAILLTGHDADTLLLMEIAVPDPGKVADERF